MPFACAGLAVVRRWLWASLACLLACSMAGLPPQRLQAASPFEESPAEGTVSWAGDAAAVPLRVRIEWGGGDERQWQGVIRVSDGTLAEPALLGIEADEPGSMWLTDDARGLHVRQRSPRLYDGVDITLKAPLEARLSIELESFTSPALQQSPDAPAAGAQRALVELSLSELLEGYHHRDLDEAGTRLMVRRAPGDMLRVELPGDSLVFATGQTVDFTLRPHGLPIADTRLRVECHLQPARGKRVLWSRDLDVALDANGSADGVGVRLPLPEAEGVYDLVIAACRGGFTNRLGLKQVVEQRTVQLVVLGHAPPSADLDAPPPMQTIVELDPARPAWWERLAQVPLLPGLGRGPLGNGDAATWRHPLGPMVQLGPGGREPDISWEAYPLPIHRPGQPHILEVEYPSDVPQTLGLSIIEPNAAGAVLPIGLDSGVYVPDESAGTPPRLERHRLIFWPRTRSPMLLVTNRRDGSRAVYGKIRVLGPRSPGIGSLARDTLVSRLPPAFESPPGRNQRLMAAYFDRPLFAENFSASEDLDSFSRRSLDDWQTFYEGGVRLREYLKHVGHNGAMITVLADGSAIYPSRLLESTPRYDTGVFFATGQDPFRKDVLELLLRLFDREGLQLIPALDFSAPLPALEMALRRGGPQTEGIELVGLGGSTWLEEHASRRGLAPYYNPLDERVQQAMLDVVRELMDRYAHHPALAGLAVQLSAGGYAQLPGAEWGCDDRTLARFSRETRIQLPLGKDARDRQAELLAGPHRDAWLDWRAKTLNHFHRRLQAELAAARPGCRLYLAAAHMLDSPEFSRQLRPALPRTVSNEEVLKTAGIDPALYRGLDQVMFLRPQRIAPLNSLADQAINIELNHDARLDKLFGAPDDQLEPPPGAGAGSLFFHEPQSARLASFDAKSPFKRTHAWLVSQPVVCSPHTRRRFVHALAALDARAMFDGGWLLPMGQEDDLRDIISVYRELPDAPFETLPGDSQPVTVRTLAGADRTLVYLVNDSPWKVTVRIPVAGNSQCRVQTLGSGRRLPAFAGQNGEQSWTVPMEPYELAAAAMVGPPVRLGPPTIELEPGIAEALLSRIEDLESRAIVLKQPPPIDVLSNPGFEQSLDRGAIAGWQFTEQDYPAAGAAASEAGAELVSSDAKEGKHSLRLFGSTGSVWLSSEPFPAPDTGWLSLTVWLRVADVDRQPALRLILEGTLDGRPYQRTTAVGRGRDVPRLAEAWGQYSFEFPDLPTARLSDLQVRFELTGPDEVQIDEVRIFSLQQLDDPSAWEITKITGSARVNCQKGRYSDCMRLLNGYWPRYLASHVVLSEQSASAAARAAPEEPEQPPAPVEKTGVLDRVKRAFGGLWR